MPVRNVIFDLGGVLLDLHVERTHQAFAALGVPDFKAQWSLTRQTAGFDALETGAITPATFRDSLRQGLSLDADDAAIDAAWNAMLGDIPAARLRYVQSLRPRYRTFALSNTNAIHLAFLYEHCRTVHGRDSLDSFFEKAHFSHELGHRKPTPEAFTAVLKLHNLVAAQTLFVDDLPANIAAAQALGLQTVLVPQGAEVATLLNL